MQDQRIALVTGASSGIGRAIAGRLVRDGFAVFGTSRHPERVEAMPGIRYLPLDVRRDDSVHACVSAVLAERGRVDVLVNNAGYVLAGAIEDVSIEEAQAQFDTNFFGTARMVKAVLPGMRQERSGRIINISSLAGLVPAPPFCGIYSASKYAVESYTEHLRREVRPFGVHVALVEPGSIRTSLTGNRRNPREPLDHYEPWRQRALDGLRRLEDAAPEPTLVADCVLHIIQNASPKVRYRVGRDATWVPRLRHLLPEGLFEKGLRRTFRLDAEP